MSWIGFLLVGVVAGWLASLLVGGGGLLRNMVVGVLGAYVGPVALSLLGFSVGTGVPILTSLIVATVGAVVVILVARLIR
ncbi:MAG: GlsB/YeaQ/YmgE family stress response membrane protein [Pseudomonadota bacterium]